MLSGLYKMKGSDYEDMPMIRPSRGQSRDPKSLVDFFHLGWFELGAHSLSLRILTSEGNGQV